MKRGDIVVRKSYDKDIIFKVIDIKEVRGKTYCILKGLSIRIIADSPRDDLEVVDYGYVEEKEKILNSRVNEAMKKAKGIQRKIGMREQINCRSNKNQKSQAVNNDMFFGRPGKILHIDGDNEYLARCLKLYKKFNVMPYGVAMKEDEIKEHTRHHTSMCITVIT